MFKRILSIVLCIIMVVSFAAVGTQATTAEGQKKEDSFTIPIIGFIIDLLPHLITGMNDITISFTETEKENVLQMKADFFSNDGSPAEMLIPFYYDTAKGFVYGDDLLKGFFEAGFNYYVDGSVFVSTKDCWQRQFGFTPLYDLFANMGLMDYVTERVYFNHDGTDYMVQMWMGNYFFDILAGGELGIYYKPEYAITGGFYNCGADEHMIPMSIKVYDEEKIYVDHDPYLTWWATGFVFSYGKIDKHELVMEATMEFPSAEMCEAFAQAAKWSRDLTVITKDNIALINWK